MDGFVEAFHTQLQLAKAEEADHGRQELPAKVSKSWVQRRLQDLKAKQTKSPCNEANRVTPEDAQDYKPGLA